MLLQKNQLLQPILELLPDFKEEFSLGENTQVILGLDRIDYTKGILERLRAVASHYQQTHRNLPSLWRIDVVAIELNQKLKLSRIELIENAVGEA